MTRALFPAFLLFVLTAGGVTAQEVVVVPVTSSKPRAEIAPQFRCHYSRKDRSFCKVFPNFSRRHDICDPTLLGHIEWCREDVTITEADDCGNFETYEAVTITYRKVYANGAWGAKFRKTYRKDPYVLSTPPLLAKGVVK